MQYPGSGYGQGGPPMQYGGGYRDRSCREFSQTGHCRFGSNCKFTHDIRPGGQDFGGQPGNPSVQTAVFKTRLCPQFTETGHCRYGVQCKFAHGEHELHDFKGFSEPSQPAMQQQQPQYQQHPGAPAAAQQQGAGSTGQEQQAGYSRPQGNRPPLAPGQQQMQQQFQPQQQQQPDSGSGQGGQQQQPGFVQLRPGGITYVDRLRAMCKALNVGQVGELVSEEAMNAAIRSFQKGTAFKENRFADSVEEYLTPA